MNHYLKIKPARLSQLIHREFLLTKKELIFTFLALAAVLLIFRFIYGLSGKPANIFILSPSFFLSWGLLGAIHGSRSLAQTHKKGENDDYLMLPASPTEKVLTKLLFIQIFFPVTILTVLIFSQFLAGTGLILTGTGRTWSDLSFQLGSSMEEIPVEIRDSILTSSIFMLGSIWFRSHQFFKTLLFFAIMLLFTILLTFVVMRATGVTNFSLTLSSLTFGDSSSVFYNLVSWLFIPYIWVVIWFRLRETESRFAI